MFGPYIDPLSMGLQYYRISSLPRAPFRIHFPYWRLMPRSSAIAFEDSYRRDTHTPAVAAAIRHPPTNAFWHYSTCQLSHVARISLCRTQGKESRRVMGMLLFYIDGRRACVGQYRLDWAMRPQVVCGSSFKVRSVRKRIGQAYCYRDVDVEVDGSSVGDETLRSWRLIPWSGMMEWCFTGRTSVIYHHNT